jgi:hypothetical protein
MIELQKFGEVPSRLLPCRQGGTFVGAAALVDTGSLGAGADSVTRLLSDRGSDARRRVPTPRRATSAISWLSI